MNAIFASSPPPELVSCVAQATPVAGKYPVVVLVGIRNPDTHKRTFGVSVFLSRSTPDPVATSATPVNGASPPVASPPQPESVGTWTDVSAGSSDIVKIETPYFSSTPFENVQGAFRGHTPTSHKDAEVKFSALVRSHSSPSHH